MSVGGGETCAQRVQPWLFLKHPFFFLLRQGTSLAWNFLYKPSKFKAKEAL